MSIPFNGYVVVTDNPVWKDWGGIIYDSASPTEDDCKRWLQVTFSDLALQKFKFTVVPFAGIVTISGGDDA